MLTFAKFNCSKQSNLQKFELTFSLLKKNNKQQLNIKKTKTVKHEQKE